MVVSLSDFKDPYLFMFLVKEAQIKGLVSNTISLYEKKLEDVKELNIKVEPTIVQGEIS